MTTTPVTSITYEQLAELEEICRQQAFTCCGNYSVGGEYMGQWERVCCMEPESTGEDISWPAEEILDLIASLRAAEADAKRYRKFRHNASVNRGMSHAEVDEEFDTAMQFVEEAMERKA